MLTTFFSGAKYRIPTSFSTAGIMGLIQLLTGIFLIPFLTADLIYFYDIENYPCLSVQSNNLTLGYFLFVDAYTKIAIYVAMWFCNAVSTQFKNKRWLLVCQSTLLRFYYYFLIGWMVTGAVMYWSDIYQNYTCDSGLNAYLFSLFIISFVECILNIFVITCLRNEEEAEVQGETIAISARETELIKR